MRLLFLLLSCAALGCASSGDSSSSNADPAAAQGAGGAGGTGGGAGGEGGGSTAPPKVLPPATGMAIGEVSINQGVKIPLYQNGADVAQRNAPIVAGRDGLVRVFFAPKDDWQPHPITVRMTLQKGEETPVHYEITGTPVAASSDADINSSANFDIPYTMLDGTLKIRVEFLDAEPGASGDTSGSSWPAEGFAPFGEQSTGGPLKLVIVPVKYNADGSGRVPDVSPERIEEFRLGFLRQYPTSSVEVSVAPEYNWSSKISPNGQNWDVLLQSIIGKRNSDKVGRDVYYYGLFNPSNSLASFCGGGCVAGLTFLTGNPKDAQLRASVGMGFPGAETISTMLHEIGHAHRRTHAPCGPFGQLPDQIDPGFPYKTGKIGVWGYDVIDRILKDPNKQTDMMGYCSPTWVSDYTYAKLFERIVAINAGGYIFGKPTRWRQAWINGEGSLRWGDVTEFDLEPGGEPREVTLGEGADSVSVKGYFYPLSHLPGGMVLVPEQAPTHRALSTSVEGVFRE